MFWDKVWFFHTKIKKKKKRDGSDTGQIEWVREQREIKASNFLDNRSTFTVQETLKYSQTL